LPFLLQPDSVLTSAQLQCPGEELKTYQNMTACTGPPGCTCFRPDNTWFYVYWIAVLSFWSVGAWWLRRRFVAATRAPEISPLIAVAFRVGAFAATFVASLFAVPVLSFLLATVLPRVARNFLFFWPQLALAPFGFTHPARDTTHTYLGGGANYAIAVLFWLLVGIGLSWALRTRRVRLTAFAAIPLSFAIAIAAQQVLDHYDIGIYFEGL
jgi:hypothetical protein